MSSLELTGPRCGTWAGLGGVVSTTACDPALVGKVALCSFAASAEVESPVDLLDCIVGGSFWVVGTPCWGDATPGCRGQLAHRLAREEVCQKGHTYPFYIPDFPLVRGRDA